MLTSASGMDMLAKNSSSFTGKGIKLWLKPANTMLAELISDGMGLYLNI